MKRSKTPDAKNCLLWFSLELSYMLTVIIQISRDRYVVPIATALPHKEKPGFMYIPPGFMHTLSYIILIILFISHMGYKSF